MPLTKPLPADFVIRMLAELDTPRVIENCDHVTFPVAISRARHEGIDPVDVIGWLTNQLPSDVTHCDCQAARLLGEPIGMAAAAFAILEQQRELLKAIEEAGDYETLERTIKPIASQASRSLELFEDLKNAAWLGGCIE